MKYTLSHRLGLITNWSIFFFYKSSADLFFTLCISFSLIKTTKITLLYTIKVNVLKCLLAVPLNSFIIFGCLHSFHFSKSVVSIKKYWESKAFYHHNKSWETKKKTKSMKHFFISAYCYNFLYFGLFSLKYYL